MAAPAGGAHALDRGNPVSHRQDTLPPADANHVKVIPDIHGAGATLSLEANREFALRLASPKIGPRQPAAFKNLLFHRALLLYSQYR